MLPRACRLRKNRDFRPIYAKGRSYVNPVAVLYVLKRRTSVGRDVGSSPDSRESETGGVRIGFVVSKKQGKANVRNRIRRRLREAVRLHSPSQFPHKLDLIIVGRSAALTSSWPDVCNAVRQLLVQGGVIPATVSEVSAPSEATAVV